MTAAEVMALIRATEKKFYCYVLRRPDGTPFYVGVGTGRRILLHKTRDTLRGNKTSLIERALGDGTDADYSIAGFYGIREFAIAEERKLIAHYGRADLGTGSLVNRSAGGEGTSGVIWRQETLDRRSAALTGRKLSEEHVAAMSEAGKRRDVTPFVEGARRWREENREAMIAERRERWNKPGVRERHAEAMDRPEYRAALAQAMNERIQDPKKRSKLVDAIRAARAHPAVINGVWYPSVTEAAKKTGISRWLITERIRRRQPGYEKSE